MVECESVCGQTREAGDLSQENCLLIPVTLLLDWISKESGSTQLRQWVQVGTSREECVWSVCVHVCKRNAPGSSVRL